MKPIIYLNEDHKQEFQRMEKVMKLHLLLDRCQADESARAALNGLLPADWSKFSYDNFDQFRSLTQDKIFCEALDLWKSEYEAKTLQEARMGEWTKFFTNRTSRITSLLGEKFPKSLPVLLNDGLSLTLELSPVLGFVLNYSSLDRTLTDSSSHIECSSDVQITVEKPSVYSRTRNFGGDAVYSSMRVIGVNSKLQVIDSQYVRKIIILASREPHMLLLDFEECSDGSTSRRKAVFNSANGEWQAILRIGEDLRYVLDREFLSLAVSSSDKMNMSSLTITGSDFLSFDQDLFLSFLFFATQAQYVPIETQYLDETNAVIGIEIGAYRELRPQWFYSTRSNFIADSQMIKIWELVSALPVDSPISFSQTHFKIIINSIISLLRQPLQKAIVDCYQILDTMAKLHSDVPRTKTTQENFTSNKNLQLQLLHRLRDQLELESSANAKIDSEVRAALDGVKNLIDNQKNDFSVVQSVIALLKACGIIYDKNDIVQKTALDLRTKSPTTLLRFK
jgi:hypothetical protein